MNAHAPRGRRIAAREPPSGLPSARARLARLVAFDARAARRRALLAAIPLVLGAAFLMLDARLGALLREGAIEEARRDMAQAASAIAEHMNRALESADVVSGSLARALLAPADTPPEEAILQRAERLPHLRGWALAGPEGVVARASAEEMLGIALGGRPWFAALASAGSRPVLGPPEGGRYLSVAPPAIAEAGRWTIPLGRRLETPGGETAGYMLVLLNPTYLADIAARGSGVPASRLRFYTRDGVLLASSRDETAGVGGRADGAWFLREVLPRRDHGVHVGTDGAGRAAVAAFQLTADGLVAVEASRDMAAVLDGVQAAMLEIRAWGVGVIGIALLALVLFERLRERATRREIVTARAELDRGLAAREAALLRRSREMIDQLHAGLPAIIFTRRVEADGSSRLLYRGGDIEAVTGWPAGADEAMEQLPGLALEEGEDHIRVALVTGESSVDGRLRQPDGSFRWIETRCRRLSRSPDGGGEVVGYSVDVTARKDLEEQIRRLALHDPLTALPNRRHLLGRLDETMRRQKRSGAWGALVFIDLDRFKVLNDSYGHEAGDEVLVEVARRLVSGLREVDTIARFGGDEFVVLLEQLGRDPHSAEAALQVVLRKLSARLAQPYLVHVARPGGQDDTVIHDAGCSLGAVLFPPRAPAPETLIGRADACMYEAKRAGKGRYRYLVMGAADA